MSQLPLETRRRRFSLRRRGVLPGFGLTLGYTIFYVGLLVLLPLFALVFKSSTQGFSAFVSAVTDETTTRGAGYDDRVALSVTAGYCSGSAGRRTAAATASEPARLRTTV